MRRLFGASPLSDDSRPWYLGALGELAVAQRLATLDPAWTVLHAVPIGTRGSDIDHVVAGPAGVFTINTKFHERATVWVGARRILVNGQKTDHLRNARYEATRVARMLAQRTGASVPTRAVIVLVNPRRFTIRQQPEDVTVLTSAQLTRWLGRRPRQLDDEATAEVAATIADPSFWAAETPSVDMSAFTAVRRSVEATRRTRIRWALTGMLALSGAVPVMLMGAWSILIR